MLPAQWLTLRDGILMLRTVLIGNAEWDRMWRNRICRMLS